MIEGLVYDPYHEFFIQSAVKGRLVADNAMQTSGSDGSELGISGVTGRQLQALVSQPLNFLFHSVCCTLLCRFSSFCSLKSDNMDVLHLFWC